MSEAGEDPARRRLVVLLDEVGQGRADALRALYRLTAAKLYGITLRVTGDAGGAEEAMQDAYVRIWRKAAVFDPARASPITWMATIARNCAIDWRRAHGVRHVAEEEPIASEAMAATVDGLALLERRSGRHHILACIEALEPGQARAVRMAFYDGLTHGELASHLRVPLGTCKSWIRRALIALRDCIDDAG